jgi:hypothetical protein
MGCDIHAHLEVRDYSYDDENKERGIWFNTDKWTVNKDSVFYPEDYPNRFHIDYDDRIYKGRNYCLFAVLVNVRNYWEIKSISEPKGLPDDISEETKKESDDYGCDGHSHTYLTLEEILNYPHWDKDEEGTDFAFNEERKAEMEKEYGDRLISSLPNESWGYKIRYKTTIKELCSEFYNETIPKLKKYLREHDNPKYQINADDIRLVFWFDN